MEGSNLVKVKQKSEHLKFTINGVNIQNIRYADDTVLLARNKDELENPLYILKEESENRGLKINMKKTKLMVFSKNKIPPNCKITLDDEELQQVESFKYLGSILTHDCRCTSDIKTRIALAKTFFTDMSNTLTNNKLESGTKKRMMKCYIWSTLTYGCESWTFRKQDESRLEAMEMWIYRQMKKISWIDKKSNKEVLEMIGEERKLLKTIRQRQLRFIGHIVREDSIEKLSLEGKVEGCRSRGRQRQDFLQGLAKAVGMKMVELLRLAQDRNGFKNMVANVRL